MKKIFQEEYIDPFKPGYLAIRAEHYARYAWAVKKLRSAFPGGAVVYDIGCGGGYGAWMLHKAGFKVVGLDRSEKLLESARQQYRGPQYLQMDLEENSLVDYVREQGLAKPDAFVVFETLEHIMNPAEVVGAMYNLLPKGGRVIASVPNEKFEPTKKGKPRNPHHKQLFTRRRFRKLFVGNGFRPGKLLGQAVTNFLYHRARWVYYILDEFVAESTTRFKFVSRIVGWPRRLFMKWSYSFVMESVK